MKTSIKFKPLVLFTISFIIFTAVGTVSHELGHISVGKLFGFETYLSYSSSSSHSSELSTKLTNIYRENKDAIKNGTDFPQKEMYDKEIKKLNFQYLLITIGGPAQTTLTGVLGLLILYWRKGKREKNGFRFIDWLAVFLSLFWLREVFNLVMSLTSEFIQPSGRYFGGDEAQISQVLEIPTGTIPIIMATLGLAICIFVVFKIVPSKLRVTFILSGLIGGLSGFYLWMNIIGPILFA